MLKAEAVCDWCGTEEDLTPGYVVYPPDWGHLSGYGWCCPECLDSLADLESVAKEEAK